MRVGLSFDVEDFRKNALSYLAVQSLPSAGDFREQVGVLMDLLAQRGAKATFFIHGALVEGHMDLLATIIEHGHEVGIHGIEHRRAEEVDAATFERQLAATVELIDRRLGVRVLGYRAPFFSLGPRVCWLLQVLKKLGFAYDSSACPIPGRQMLGTPVCPGVSRFGNGLYEVPVSILPFAGITALPFGGGYFRWMPYRVTRSFIRSELHRNGTAVGYFHNYDLFDLSLPIRALSGGRPGAWLRTLLISFSCGDHVRLKLRRMLADFQFCPLFKLLPLKAVPTPIADSRVERAREVLV